MEASAERQHHSGVLARGQIVRGHPSALICLHWWQWLSLELRRLPLPRLREAKRSTWWQAECRALLNRGHTCEHQVTKSDQGKAKSDHRQGQTHKDRDCSHSSCLEPHSVRSETILQWTGTDLLQQRSWVNNSDAARLRVSKYHQSQWHGLDSSELENHLQIVSPNFFRPIKEWEYLTKY